MNCKVCQAELTSQDEFENSICFECQEQMETMSDSIYNDMVNQEYPING